VSKHKKNNIIYACGENNSFSTYLYIYIHYCELYNSMKQKRNVVYAREIIIVFFFIFFFNNKIFCTAALIIMGIPTHIFILILIACTYYIYVFKYAIYHTEFSNCTLYGMYNIFCTNSKYIIAVLIYQLYRTNFLYFLTILKFSFVYKNHVNRCFMHSFHE
jgi:hypothetical protein